MNDVSKAEIFRRRIRNAGLTIEEPFLRKSGHEVEKKFMFILKRGAIVTPRDPLLLLRLLGIARDVWGRGKDGEYKELLSTVIAAGEIQSFPNVVWRPCEQPSGCLMFRQWIADQFLFFAAVRLTGFG